MMMAAGVRYTLIALGPAIFLYASVRRMAGAPRPVRDAAGIERLRQCPRCLDARPPPPEPVLLGDNATSGHSCPPTPREPRLGFLLPMRSRSSLDLISSTTSSTSVATNPSAPRHRPSLPAIAPSSPASQNIPPLSCPSTPAPPTRTWESAVRLWRIPTCSWFPSATFPHPTFSVPVMGDGRSLAIAAGPKKAGEWRRCVCDRGPMRKECTLRAYDGASRNWRPNLHSHDTLTRCHVPHALRAWAKLPELCHQLSSW